MTIDYGKRWHEQHFQSTTGEYKWGAGYVPFRTCVDHGKIPWCDGVSAWGKGMIALRQQSTPKNMDVSNRGTSNTYYTV